MNRNSRTPLLPKATRRVVVTPKEAQSIAWTVLTYLFLFASVAAIFVFVFALVQSNDLQTLNSRFLKQNESITEIVRRKNDLLAKDASIIQMIVALFSSIFLETTEREQSDEFQFELLQNITNERIEADIALNETLCDLIMDRQQEGESLA